MRDGVNLSADIYLPENKGAYPTVIIGTPYDNTMRSHVEMACFFVKHDYSFVVYDVRGRFDSEGEFYPFFNEGKDGYDMVEWVAKQLWSNGKIGMMGGSYRGWIQWATAREKPPHLATMVPTATGGKYLEEFPFFNGIPCLWMLGWMNFVGGRTTQNTASYTVDWEKVFKTLPLVDIPEALGREIPVWKEWMDHPDWDEFWDPLRFSEKDFASINIPALHITGFYDGDQPGALEFYDGAIKYGPLAENQYMIMGPWNHAGTRFPKRYIGGVDFSNASLMEMKDIHLKWFDHWLKGFDNEVKDWPLTRYFIMGENRWVNSNTHWPPSEPSNIWYLTSGGNANTLKGDGSLSKDQVDDGYDNYKYDPMNPAVPELSYDFYGGGPEPSLDQRYMLRRDDHLVYASNILEKPILCVGSPVVELFVSSNCPDTDFFIKILDVYPDERCIAVSRGLMRARYRGGLNRQILMEKDEIYKIKIIMDSTGLTFLPGHRIMLTVTSSEFPRYARNNNTGNPVGSDIEVRIAHNKIHYGEGNASHILLP
ncbi:MAG: CocE/NonD family hydrolase [Promethearchaeota archaeon]